MGKKEIVGIKTFDVMAKIILGDKSVLVVTSRNFSDNCGTFKLFSNITEANNWHHDVSLQQLPDWHLKNCNVCAEKKTSEAVE